MTHLTAALAAAVGAAVLAAPAAAVPASATVLRSVDQQSGVAAASRRASGRLLVTVRGLPDGVDADVVVDGPGDFRVRVTDTRKLQHLRRGRYELTVRPVDRATGTYRGRVDDDLIQVRPRLTRDVTVAYRWDPNEVESAVQLSAFEAEVLRLTNRARSTGQNCGSEGVFGKAAPLGANAKLTTAARRHARDMADRGYFSHTGRDGRSPGNRITAAGYRWSWWGENIAAGFDTPKSVVDAWVESDGHCANLMDRHFTQLGVGYAKRAGSDYGTYWVQDFGRPR